ncbi:hypothetical protein MKW92_026070 [Papaver armeniacum]|nr:hypothetical protein MKW92_026070 [Papaver armeniacum]
MKHSRSALASAPRTKRIYFRSSLEQIVEIAENIRAKITDKPKHLEAMQKCPFWNFYRPFHEGRINERDMRKKHMGLELILNTFDPVKEVFQLQGEKEFKSTPQHLALIFGFQRIKWREDYTIRYPYKPELYAAQTVFCTTYLKGATLIKKKDIIDSLYATAEDVTKPDDFVKLLVLYFCVAIFFPDLSGGRLPSKIYLNYIFAMDQISWPDLIHSHLMEALREAEKPYISVKGCTVYILFWFAEVTHFISKNEGELGKWKPRFARWNLKLLADKIENEGMTFLKQDLTGSFIDPLEKGEETLITPIELHQANSHRIDDKMDRHRNGDSESYQKRDAELFDIRSFFHILQVVYQSKKRKISIEEPMMPAIPILPTQKSEPKENDNDGSVFLSKKRKASIEEFQPREGMGICNCEDEHLYSSEPITIPAIPILVTQESMSNENENNIHHNTMKDSCGMDVHKWSMSSCPGAKTTETEVSELVGEPVDATINTSCSKGLTFDSCLLNISTSVDAIPIPPGFTTASAQEGVEEFEFVDNLKIPEEYLILNTKICEKYGHMATRKLIKFNDAMLLACVTSLLKIISAMENVRGSELSEALLERWEGSIKDAEALEFNVKWLREGFNRIRNHWRSSFGIDREVESHAQVLDAMQVKYVCLSTREDELNAELSEVKIQKRKAEEMISSERKAIQEKLTEKIKFQNEPVQGLLLI